MSNQQDNLKKKLSGAKQSTHKTLATKDAVEIAKTRSTKDIILWTLAFIALVAATLVNYKLPGIWQPANDIWVRIGIMVSLVVFAIICVAMTNQGRSFKILLNDAGIELRRVTWPSKSETIQYTWQTILVIAIVALIVWLLDNVFNRLIAFFIG